MLINIKSSDFKNIVKVPYIGKLSNEYEKKLEKLLNNYIEDFKVIFTTTKVSNYFSNKDTKNKVHKKKLIQMSF